MKTSYEPGIYDLEYSGDQVSKVVFEFGITMRLNSAIYPFAVQDEISKGKGKISFRARTSIWLEQRFFDFVISAPNFQKAIDNVVVNIVKWECVYES